MGQCPGSASCSALSSYHGTVTVINTNGPCWESGCTVTGASLPGPTFLTDVDWPVLLSALRS